MTRVILKDFVGRRHDNLRWARERRSQPTYIDDAVERRAMRQKLVDAHPDNPRNRGA